MIADLIDEELACRARGKNYVRGTVSKHLERQMDEINDHARFCKRYGKPSHRSTVDKLAAEYEALLADIANEEHRLMILRRRDPNAGWSLYVNRERYRLLDEIAERMFVPAIKPKYPPDCDQRGRKKKPRGRPFQKKG